MLLIQTIKQFSTGAEGSEELTTYASSLGLSDALRALREYEAVYRRYYKTATTEHRVIGVQTLPCELSDDDLAHARMFKIENILRDLLGIEAHMSLGRA